MYNNKPNIYPCGMSTSLYILEQQSSDCNKTFSAAKKGAIGGYPFLYNIEGIQIRATSIIVSLYIFREITGHLISSKLYFTNIDSIQKTIARNNIA